MIKDEYYYIAKNSPLVTYHRHTGRQFVYWKTLNPLLFWYKRIVDTYEENPRKVAVGKFELSSKGKIEPTGNPQSWPRSKWEVENIAYKEADDKYYINIAYELSELNVYKFGTDGSFDLVILGNSFS